MKKFIRKIRPWQRLLICLALLVLAVISAGNKRTELGLGAALFYAIVFLVFVLLCALYRYGEEDDSGDK